MRALERHDIWPRRTPYAVAGAVVALELGLASAGLMLGPEVGVGTTGWIVTAIGAALFTAFALYSLVLLRSRPGTPCGCGPGDRGVDKLVAGRAIALAATSWAVVIWRPALADPGFTAWEAAVVLEAALAFAVLTFVVPSALSRPTEATPREPAL